jgi:hypothetical protein
LDDGRGVGPNNAADGHEEAGRKVSSHRSGDFCLVCLGEDQTYPKVAPEPSMYCPSVLMMPFGPAPYLKMLTVPALRVRPPAPSKFKLGP